LSVSDPKSFQEVLSLARSGLAEALHKTDEIMMDVAHHAPVYLNQKLDRIMARKGKRVRSTLLFLLAGTGSQPLQVQRGAQVAASIELLHLASLIHDDVIDASEMRRGISTAHAEWGNKMAVLVGDYALSKSMELVVNDPDRRILQIVCESSGKLVCGEVLELDLAGKLDVSLEQYLEVIDGKTASLIEACTMCGAIIAGHSQSDVDACGRMGLHFGTAFQIIDDLLDFGVGASNLGKKPFEDLANGLMTLPLLLYRNQTDTTQRLAFDALLNKASNESVQQQVVALLHESGSFQAAQKMAMDNLNNAIAILKNLPESPNQQHLVQICESMAFRAN
jgi:geranylgeranyl pyrophosphate synthase